MLQVPPVSFLEDDLARWILAVTQTKRGAVGRWERFSRFPQQLSVFMGSNADRSGASWKVTSQHASSGGGDMASLSQEHSRSASKRGLYSIRLFRPHAAAL